MKLTKSRRKLLIKACRQAIRALEHDLGDDGPEVSDEELVTWAHVLERLTTLDERELNPDR